MYLLMYRLEPVKRLPDLTGMRKAMVPDDYRTYVEIELTKGKRELTEDDVKEADALCKRYLDRWKEELE